VHDFDDVGREQRTLGTASRHLEAVLDVTGNGIVVERQQAIELQTR
jgi:hypothetical protein